MIPLFVFETACMHMRDFGHGVRGTYRIETFPGEDRP